MECSWEEVIFVFLRERGVVGGGSGGVVGRRGPARASIPTLSHANREFRYFLWPHGILDIRVHVVHINGCVERFRETGGEWLGGE
jgi:hypothetical protein